MNKIFILQTNLSKKTRYLIIMIIMRYRYKRIGAGRNLLSLSSNLYVLILLNHSLSVKQTTIQTLSKQAKIRCHKRSKREHNIPTAKSYRKTAKTHNIRDSREEKNKLIKLLTLQIFCVLHSNKNNTLKRIITTEQDIYVSNRTITRRYSVKHEQHLTRIFGLALVS
jgi:hypothetical protein